MGIKDVLPFGIKNKYSINLTLAEHVAPDELNIGYLKIDTLQESDL